MKPSSLISTLMLLLVFARASAQPVVAEGRVIDGESGEPLVGATVRLLDSAARMPGSRGAIAGVDGRFRLLLADSSDASVETSMLGYATLRSVIRPGGANVIELEGRDLLERQVEVRAARRTRSVEDACCRVESIREEVQQHAPFSPSAIDVLRRYSSCTSTRVGCAVDGSQSIRLRGLEPTYISVLVDGMPAISGLGTFYGLGIIPAHALQTISISEGASSAAAGNGAISGVVDLQTRVPTEEPELMLTGNLGGDGFMPHERDLNASYTGMLGDVGVATFLSLNNHRIDEGSIVGGYDRISGLAKASVMLDDATELVGTLLGGSERRSGRPVVLSAAEESTDHDRLDLSATLARTLDDESELVMRSLVSTSHVDARYPVSRLDARQTILFGSLVHTRELGDHTVAIGLEGRDDRLRATGAPIDFASTTLSGYLQDELYLSDEWTILGSLRYDRHSKAGGILSPRGSIRYEPIPNMTMRLMAGSGFKAQAHFDEEEHRALHGGFRWRQNDELGVERSFTVNYDISHSVVIGDVVGLDANFNAYHTTIEGKAITQLDSLSSGALFMVNSADEARLAGLELQLRPTFGEHWSGSLAVALIDYTMRNRQGVYQRMPLSTPLSIDGSLMYHDAASGVAAEVWASHVGATRLPETEGASRDSDPYTIVNIRLEKTFGAVTIHAGVQNMLDASQEPATPLVSGTADAYRADTIWGPLEGRSFFVGFRSRFSP
jgi:outer membrane receptor for ferrienterochelin and colicins